MPRYNKLIRDRIPEIIEADGKRCDVEVMAEDEYFLALRAKLIEEAEEAARAGVEDLATELADLQEVIEALCASSGVTREEIEALRAERRADRGGFERRLRLLRVDQSSG